jgi:hypothetical protein
MPVFKKYHYYVNKNKKSVYISEIIPIEDLVVPEEFFKEFNDNTEKKVARE